MNRLLSVLAAAALFSTASMSVANAEGSKAPTTGAPTKEHKAPSHAMHMAPTASAHHAHHSNTQGAKKSTK